MKASETPQPAAFGAMGALDRWADDDLGEELRYLSAPHLDQLRTQLGQLRHQMLSMGDVTVEATHYRASMTGDGQATVVHGGGGRGDVGIRGEQDQDAGGHRRASVLKGR